VTITPPPPPPPPDPALALADRMKIQLARFTEWAHDHAHAACPSAADLGAPVLDPWQHPLAITCTDQPANQIIGVVSSGPDGIAGNADDVGSWQLSREVTDLVRGARWTAAKPAPTPSPARPRPPRAKPEDDIPTER
jgi:hypothetical protein